VSPYPPLPDDEPDGRRPGPSGYGQPGYGGASPYPAYTPYGPGDEIADDALTDYGLPSPQSYGYAPPPPLPEPLPGLGVPEPRFGQPSSPSPADSAAPGRPAPAGPVYREDGPVYRDSEPVYRESEPGYRESEPGYRESEPRYRDGGRPDRDFPDRDVRDVRDGGFPDEGFRVDEPFTADDDPAVSGRLDDDDRPPLAPELGDRLVAGHRADLGRPGQHQAPADDGPRRAGDPGRREAGDASLRDAPPPTGFAQPGVAPPGMGPGRNPASAPPLGRPVAPARPQPGYPPAGPPPGGAPRGPVPGGPGPGGLPPRPGYDEEDYGPGPEDGSGGETSDSLTAEALLQGKRTAPGSGWRRTVYRATGGLVRVGESAGMQRRRELVWRARTPVAGGHHRVAVMSLKGGVGKTTTTVGLGATLGTLRGDRVIAVDANPDRGTLSDKVRLETSATVRDLLNERQQVHRYADVRAFTSQAPSRLEVLASDRDPGVSVAFSDADYRDVARVLEHYYSICITDCGTGLLHSAMGGVLALADQIVLVSSPSVDGARSASATLDWLDAHDYSDLVRNAVVVLSTVRPRSKSTVDLDRLEQHFAARCRDVVRVPYDPHLEEGAEVELEQLSAATTEAYLRLAATVGDGFAWPRRAVNRGANA
jgi:MinD-like ATPase involved in chromosome partitioning or flagellar assembly